MHSPPHQKTHERILARLTTAGLVISSQLLSPQETISGFSLPARLSSLNPAFGAWGAVAYRGQTYDHHDALGSMNVPLALVEEVPSHTTSYIQLKDARKGWSLIMGFIWCHEAPMFLAAVTGTNGKSSTAWIMAGLWRARGQPALALGTFGARSHTWDVHSCALPFGISRLTTQDPDCLYPLLYFAKLHGISRVVMEVSSHSLEHSRVYGLSFDLVAWTSFSQDHLDFHGTLENYFDAKKQLFFHPYSHTSTHKVLSETVITAGDLGAQLAQELKQNFHTPLSGDKATEILSDWEGAPPMTLAQQNLLFATCCVALSENLTEKEVKKSVIASGVPMEQITDIPGRLRVVRRKHPQVIVDYAHSPEALELALHEARIYAGQTAALICVFGCGGDRDRSKRPLMTKIALKFARHIFITSDNPRSEDPQSIFSDMCAQLSKEERKRIFQVADRKEAIAAALNFASTLPQACVLIAGKGDERYQLIKGKALPFSDAGEVKVFFGSKKQKKDTTTN